MPRVEQVANGSFLITKAVKRERREKEGGRQWIRREPIGSRESSRHPGRIRPVGCGYTQPVKQLSQRLVVGTGSVEEKAFFLPSGSGFGPALERGSGCRGRDLLVHRYSD